MLVTKPAFTTTNSLIAVSVPEKRDTQVKFDDFGIAEVSNQKEFCVLTVLFDSDCGYRKGQTVFVEGDLVKHQYKVYTVDGVTFTLISKDLVRGFVQTPEQFAEENYDPWSSRLTKVYTEYRDPTDEPRTEYFQNSTNPTMVPSVFSSTHLVVKPDPEDGA